MAKEQKEMLEQNLGRLSLKRMKVASQAQAIQEQLNALNTEMADIAQKLIKLESKNED